MFKKLMLDNPRFRYTMYFLNAIWVSIKAVFENGFDDDNDDNITSLSITNDKTTAH